MPNHPDPQRADRTRFDAFRVQPFGFLYAQRIGVDRDRLAGYAEGVYSLNCFRKSDKAPQGAFRVPVAKKTDLG